MISVWVFKIFECICIYNIYCDVLLSTVYKVM